MNLLAGIEAFKLRHAVDEPDQESTVEARLLDASALILSEISDSEADWVVAALSDASGGPEPPQAVVMIAIEVAYRAWANPDALARSEIGDVAAYYREGPEDAVYLTKREMRTINRAVGRSSFRAVTLTSPYSGDA